MKNNNFNVLPPKAELRTSYIIEAENRYLDAAVIAFKALLFESPGKKRRASERALRLKKHLDFVLNR